MLSREGYTGCAVSVLSCCIETDDCDPSNRLEIKVESLMSDYTGVTAQKSTKYSQWVGGTKQSCSVIGGANCTVTMMSNGTCM